MPSPFALPGVFCVLCASNPSEILRIEEREASKKFKSCSLKLKTFSAVFVVPAEFLKAIRLEPDLHGCVVGPEYVG